MKAWIGVILALCVVVGCLCFKAGRDETRFRALNEQVDVMTKKVANLESVQTDMLLDLETATNKLDRLALSHWYLLQSYSSALETLVKAGILEKDDGQDDAPPEPQKQKDNTQYL